MKGVSKVDADGGPARKRGLEAYWNKKSSRSQATETALAQEPPSSESKLKRKRSDEDGASPNEPVPQSGEPLAKARATAPTKKRSSGSTRSAAPSTPVVNNLRDTLRPDLSLVLIGLNPGIMTATKGQPYAHPSNSYWKHLYTSGITPVQHKPPDYIQLPDLYAIGNTNICARPTRLGSELSKAELREGAQILDDKIAQYRPEAVCITGKGVWESMWRFKTGKTKFSAGDFEYGWQKEALWLGRTLDPKTRQVAWKGARTFVVPSTSGLNAGLTQAEKDEIWRPIGEWMKEKREGQKAE